MGVTLLSQGAVLARWNHYSHMATISKTVWQHTENIEQISCQLPETILLCNGCVAQHYYKTAATHCNHYI